MNPLEYLQFNLCGVKLSHWSSADVANLSAKEVYDKSYQ